MAAQRPPRAAVRAAVRACLADLDPGERVVVALSGGADSLALTAAALAVGTERGLLCEVVVIDHQLQPGSGEVAERAAGQARILGCANVRVMAVEVPVGAGSGGREAAARAARYAALDAVSGAPPALPAPPKRGSSGAEPPSVLTRASPAEPPAAAVLLGHTREDQAETVLLGLARGSGTRSLAGMAARAGVYRRPLLDLPREVVVAAARAAADDDPRLEPWSDPHNADTAFLRVRVRATVLPVLEAQLGPGIVEALARTAALAREDADALDGWADRVWEQVREGSTGSASLRVVEQPLPPAIVHRMVRRFLLEAGCPTGSLTAAHIRSVAALLEPGASARTEVALPGGRRARREAAAVVVRV